MDLETQYLHMMRRWFELCQRAITLLVYILAQAYTNEFHRTKIGYSLSGKRERVRDGIMNRISSCPSSCNIIRMTPKVFLELCTMLERESGLQTTRWASVEEQVAKTLYILLTHGAKNREVNFWFRRSSETISRHFHNVLAAIIELEEKFVIQLDGSEISPEICQYLDYTYILIFAFSKFCLECCLF